MEQASMFERQKPRRAPKPPNEVDLALDYFRGTYERGQGRKLVRTSFAAWAEDKKHIKRLLSLGLDEREWRGVLDAYADCDDDFTIANGHQLRHALVDWRFQKLLATARQSQPARPPVVFKTKAVDPKPAETVEAVIARLEHEIEVAASPLRRMALRRRVAALRAGDVE